MVPALLAAAALTALQPLASSPLEFSALVAASCAASAVSLPSISPLFLDTVSEAERPSALAMRQSLQVGFSAAEGGGEILWPFSFRGAQECPPPPREAFSMLRFLVVM